MTTCPTFIRLNAALVRILAQQGRDVAVSVSAIRRTILWLRWNNCWGCPVSWKKALQTICEAGGHLILSNMCEVALSKLLANLHCFDDFDFGFRPHFFLLMHSSARGFINGRKCRLGSHGSLRAYQIFVYFEEEPGRRSAAKLLSKGAASRTATDPETARRSCP